MLAAMKWERNSLGIEIDPDYCRMAARRILEENENLFSTTDFECIHAPEAGKEVLALHETPVAYRINKPRKKKLASK